MCAFCTSDAACIADLSIGCGLCANSDRPCLTEHDCALAEHVCTSSTDTRCVTEYREPDYHTVQPGHIAIDRTGALWYTSYFVGNSIRRFEPSDGTFTTFRLPTPAVTSQATAFGAWPWDILVTRRRDVFFTGYASGQVGRIDGAKVRDPSIDCSSPIVGGDFCDKPRFGGSPCVDMRTIPGPPQMVHSIIEDHRGRVWFSAAGAYDDPGVPSSVGFVTRDLAEIVLLPPLSLFPFVSEGDTCAPPGDFESFLGAGIAYDRRSRAILVADYCRGRVVRIRPQGRLR
jgi:hypothetical protein